MDWGLGPFTPLEIFSEASNLLEGRADEDALGGNAGSGTPDALGLGAAAFFKITCLMGLLRCHGFGCF